ncbi:hypothetical protein F4814DRAFT_458329 [Daldinia grandis]|nr:hypothetical protein F4814DRAFT_458329 [Daldinia grandis]
MMLFQPIVILLSIAGNAICNPAEDTPQVELSTITSGEYTFIGVGGTSDLGKRCSGYLTQHADCTPGKCQCLGNNGCWACNGGRMQCQPGPDSGECWT